MTDHEIQCNFGHESKSRPCYWIHTPFGCYLSWSIWSPVNYPLVLAIDLLLSSHFNRISQSCTYHFMPPYPVNHRSYQHPTIHPHAISMCSWPVPWHSTRETSSADLRIMLRAHAESEVPNDVFESSKFSATKTSWIPFKHLVLQSILSPKTSLNSEDLTVKVKCNSSL